MSELRVDLVSNRPGTGPASLRGQWASRAFMNLNGTGTVSIRKSGNTSSVTDGGVGSYTQNFTAAFNAADYAVTAGAEDAAGANASAAGDSNGRTVSANRIIDTTTNTRAAIDVLHHMTSVFGDLA